MMNTKKFCATNWLYKVGLRPTKQVSLATVYNTLQSFSDSGLLNKIIVDGSRCYFDTRLDNHTHFYWEATGKLSDAPGNFLEIQNLPKPPKNSKITNVDIIIRLKEY